jgi:RimJ/RimL family protein N-acetyltransferase
LDVSLFSLYFLSGGIMLLETELLLTIDDYASRKAGGNINDVVIYSPSVWNIDVSFIINENESCQIRNIREGDLDLLLKFGEGLGELSKDLFGPYPWYDAPRLHDAFTAAIQQSINHNTASYLIIRNGIPMGHFFLWAAGGNSHSREHGVELPELGVAIADAYHGHGFGGLAVRILQAVARNINADGIELTTAMTNESGWNTYLHAGFEYVGILRIPLEVDVTAATSGLVQATRYRDERQMVYIINPQKSDEILQYLKLKRIDSGTECVN